MNWLLAAWIACQALDGATTAIALTRPGFHEANPIMRGPHRYPVKIGVNVGALIFQKKVVEPRVKLIFDAQGVLVRTEQHGVTKWWRHAIPIAYASTGCLAGGLNLHTLHKGSR